MVVLAPMVRGSERETHAWRYDILYETEPESKEPSREHGAMRGDIPRLWGQICDPFTL